MAHNTREATLGWYNPGFMFYYPDAITSTEHRRRLQHVQDVARGIIGATLATACLASEIGRPTIEDVADDSSSGWRRVYVDSDEYTPKGLAVARRAVGEVSLTQEAYIDVQEGRSEGNEDTKILLSVAAETGFRRPRSLLYAAPVLNFQEAPEHAPTERLTPSRYAPVEMVYGLLPDIAIAIERAVSLVAISANVRG